MQPKAAALRRSRKEAPQREAELLIFIYRNVYLLYDKLAKVARPFPLAPLTYWQSSVGLSDCCTLGLHGTQNKRIHIFMFFQLRTVYVKNEIQQGIDGSARKPVLVHVTGYMVENTYLLAPYLDGAYLMPQWPK